VVTQIRTAKKDGYEAVQVGFGDVPDKRLRKKGGRDEDRKGFALSLPRQGGFKASGASPKRYVREIPCESIEDVELGQEIKADVFTSGDLVKVTGVSKGKGFAGAVKRWHFHGGDMTHGSMVHRKPQSGGATDAARTFKGVRRPGRMGGAQITQRGLTVYRVDAERNLILIAGAVPGATGGLLLIAKQMVGG
jgi:large subunit ribosomal protein L3